MQIKYFVAMYICHGYGIQTVGLEWTCRPQLPHIAAGTKLSNKSCPRFALSCAYSIPLQPNHPPSLATLQP